jgi:hypothetical protein
VLIFVFMHSGSRARVLCEQHGFSGTGSLSAWPPGARCAGGEPTIETTAIDPGFILAAGAIALLLCGAAALAHPGKTRRNVRDRARQH